jgi:hypothetical protein
MNAKGLQMSRHVPRATAKITHRPAANGLGKPLQKVTIKRLAFEFVTEALRVLGCKFIVVAYKLHVRPHKSSVQLTN